ncbi:MAG TPA: c-type cytochrome [Pyrinomonadaceae bacterium]|jgi:cytochrome c2
MAENFRAAKAFRLIFVCLSSTLFLVASACNQDSERAAAEMTGGDPARGRAAISRYGCSTCHTIPGVSGANGLVGPPLGQVASRVYLAGRLLNTPDHMMQWIRNPRGVDDKTAMPNLNVNETDARDITSYLYTLK